MNVCRLSLWRDILEDWRNVLSFYGGKIRVMDLELILVKTKRFIIYLLARHLRFHSEFFFYPLVSQNYGYIL